MADGLNAGMRPCVGFTVATPQVNAGKRNEPAMSLPWWMAPKPAAAAAPAPPDDPPGEASGCHGLTVRPCIGFHVVRRIEYSGAFVRPTTMAPARLRFRVIGASSGAITPARAAMPFGDGCPATSTLTLIVTGTPWSGPTGPPAATAQSASRAATIASSPRS